MSYLLPLDCCISPSIVSSKFNPLQNMTMTTFNYWILFHRLHTKAHFLYPPLQQWTSVFICFFHFLVDDKGNIAMDMRVQISFRGCLQFYSLNIQNWDGWVQCSSSSSKFLKYNINSLRISCTHTMYFNHICPLTPSLLLDLLPTSQALTNIIFSF